MMVLVTYDVSMRDPKGAKRLREIAKVCENYGVRVQYSVFECDIDPAMWVNFKNQLLEIYDSKVDSLRFYQLGKNWRHKVEHYGAKVALDLYKDAIVI